MVHLRYLNQSYSIEEKIEIFQQYRYFPKKLAIPLENALLTIAKLVGNWKCLHKVPELVN
ncbi:MAG TPA: hypothetical protein DIT08_00410 [Enterococcus sp.]|nr:hypothetical protein [Enterococcus sp.]